MNNFERLDQSYLREFNLGFFDCPINLEQMIDLLGYDRQTVPEPVLDSLDSIIRLIPSKVNLQSGFKIFNPMKFRLDDEKIIIDSQSLNCEKVIYSNLKNSDTLAIIISTVGSNLEALSKEYMTSNEMLMGYLIDKIGSELVETLADKTESFLQEYLDSFGLKITNRYSPGYCGWSVAEQKIIFSLLPDNFCGVSLNDDSMMTPLKSVSAIIGVGKNVERRNYQCTLCDVEYCYKKEHYE